MGRRPPKVNLARSNRLQSVRDFPGAWEVLVALAATALYARTVGFGWVYDDLHEIVLNTTVHSLTKLPALFTTTVWAGSGMETYLYRPLTTLSYALNVQVGGLEPWGFHAVNVLLHAVIAVLVVRVGRRWGLPPWAAGLGGLLFAVHPVHVEVAAAAFGRRDLLATVFVLWMVLAHRPALARGGWRLAVPMAAYLAAVFSKEVGIVGLGLVAAQDWYLERQPARLLSDRRAVGLYFGYVIAALGYLLARTAVTGGLGVPETTVWDNPLVDASVGTRILTALMLIGRGLAVLAVPITLSPDYSYDAIPVVTSLLDWRFLATMATFGLVGAALAWRPLRRSVLPMALAWYGIAVLLTSNLLVTTGTIFGERLLYLPSVAFCLAAGAGAVWLAARARAELVALAVVVLAALSLQTARYSAVWDNDVALFTWATQHVPRSTKAHHKLGEELARAGRHGEAVRSLRRALEIAPGNTYAAETRARLRRTLAQRFLTATDTTPRPRHPEVLYVLGQITREREDLPAAERYWLRALALDSTHAHAHADLGLLRLAAGDTTRALARLRTAVRHKADLALAWLALGQVHLARGNRGRAVETLREFLNHAGTRYPRQVVWAREVVGQTVGR